jgi:hypothetical protein
MVLLAERLQEILVAMGLLVVWGHIILVHLVIVVRMAL